MSVVKLPSYIVKQNVDLNLARTHFQRLTRTFKFNDNGILKLKSIIAPKFDAFKNSYFYRSLNLWNSLPLEIRSFESSSIFKTKVKDHLWSLAEIKFG